MNRPVTYPEHMTNTRSETKTAATMWLACATLTGIIFVLFVCTLMTVDSTGRPAGDPIGTIIWGLVTAVLLTGGLLFRRAA